LLWAGPFVLLAAMGFVLVRTLRQRRAQTVAAPLSDAERRRARELLADAPQEPR
jgi:cytochrome c-type biogenesis protein CcmH/NrfF